MMTAPAGVTRFYGNTDFGLDVLDNRQIALVRVTLLNDPFDPYGFFETDFGGYFNLLKYVQTHHPKDRGWFRQHVTPQSWGKTERDLKAYMARLRKDTFVLCASAPAGATHPRENLYMWGHYGNGHRGFAIEFDPAALEEVVLAHHCSEGGAPLVGEQPWVRLEYARSFRPISAEDVCQFLKQSNEVDARRQKEPKPTPLDSYYRQLSVIKSDVWQSENEWRLMWRSTTETAGVYKIPITPACIRAVYLGLAITDSDRQRVMDAAGRFSPDAEVWRATKRHGDLCLD
ncbi:MAG TPA: DUF2971 domain-containing protein, partial [Nitrospira sp.]|nr:DUF2971 domain-containing protein [Nitrospira sp.]